MLDSIANEVIYSEVPRPHPHPRAAAWVHNGGCQSGRTHSPATPIASPPAGSKEHTPALDDREGTATWRGADYSLLCTHRHVGSGELLARHVFFLPSNGETRFSFQHQQTLRNPRKLDTVGATERPMMKKPPPAWEITLSLTVTLHHRPGHCSRNGGQTQAQPLPSGSYP